MKKLLIRVVILGVIGAGAWYGYKLFQAMPQRQQQVATARVRRGDVVVRSFTRGEIRAVRSATLIAPNLFGTVQVTQLADLGSFAREKDLVCAFDDSEVNSRLEEKQLEIDQVGEQIKKAEADLAIRNNQDQVDLVSARFGVRRAELEVKKNELLAAIDQKKNLLNLEESKHRLQQLESDIRSRLDQAQAEMAVLREHDRKAKLELARERQRLSQVKLLSPMSGLIAIRQNRQTGFFFPGMQIPDIREGDQVQPGMPIADVLDLSELEIVAKVGELDRANLTEGQEVNIQLDAVGNKTFHGKIKNMSGTASANIFSGDPGKKFDVVFSIDMKELLSGLGAKPEQIRRVLETAEQNRKKPGMPGPAAMMMAGGPPGMMPVSAPAGGPNGGGPAPAMRMASAPAGGPVTSGGPNGGARAMVLLGGPGGPAGARPAAAQASGAGPGAAPPPPPTGPGGQPMPMPSFLGKFTEQDVAAAKLPPPAGEDSQLDVLVRPGLLADVEIIEERIPNAINIPAQAVFQKDGKMIAYVKNGNRWDERVIKPLKRSESTMVISDGLKQGEIIALADPNAKLGGGKKKSDSGGGPMGGMGAK
jgi:HlyD family secretion protein